MQEQKLVGKVIWFDAKLGYGFIARDGEKDLFVYWSDIDKKSCPDGFRTLKKGQTVEFVIGLNHDNKPKAIDVVIVNEA
jgi:CspA family cold shock protein